MLVLQKTFKCKACGFVVDESSVEEHRKTCTKISEFTGSTKFYQCQKCTYALPANLKDIHVSLCSNLYQTDQEQFKELTKQEYDSITTDYIQCGFCNKFLKQYELNEHSKICPIYIAKKPFRKYSYGDYFEVFLEEEMKKKKNSNGVLINPNSNNNVQNNNNNNKEITNKPKKNEPIKINAVITTEVTAFPNNNNNTFKKFSSTDEKVLPSQHNQQQPLLPQNNNNNISIDNSVKSSSLLMASSTKPIVVSSPPPPLSSNTTTTTTTDNKLRGRTNSACPPATNKTFTPTPTPPHRHSMGTIDTGLTSNSPVEIARTRARTSLSRGYDVRKHCRGISKSHNTVVLLSENELVWKSKGGNEFSSIGLDSISKVLCSNKRVTIKSNERDLIIDIENESDRNEFVNSLRTLITPIK